MEEITTTEGPDQTILDNEAEKAKEKEELVRPCSLELVHILASKIVVLW